MNATKTIDVTDFTEAEMAFFFDVTLGGLGVDFDPHTIRDHIFDRIVDFFAGR